MLNRERTALDAAVLRALPAVRLVCSTGTGLNHVDLDAARALGIEVVATGGGYEPAVVEQTFALLFGLLKRVPELDAEVRTGTFRRPILEEAHGRVMGIAGLGATGSRVAAAARAFGMRVLAWSPHLDDARAAEAGVERAQDLVDLARRSDVFSIHLRLRPESRGIVDAAVVDALRLGAILLNTARAELVDQAALRRRVAAGEIRVGLDVFDREPPSLDDPLLHGGGVLSPHVGWMTDGTWERFIEAGVETILRRVETDDAPVGKVEERRRT
ncbi:MAG TPA: NAD(P)-dependent oxidoreductase, partial [Candidatus Acidoferrum sp.]|nr:NAD(P)-dependent oxidoreductase [Candidatus Acidoferrum sp.]